MGLLDGFFNPAKNQVASYGKARKEFGRDTAGAKDFYGQQIGTAGQALGQYSNALGLNGQGAQQSFQDAFLTGPAYDANLRAGTDAIDQSAIFGGSSQSGNTLKALQSFGQDQYSQEYQRFLDRLMGLQGQGFGGAAGQAGLSAQKQDYRIGAGQAQDAGNAAFAGNLAGLIGWGAGRFNFGRDAR